ncbi:MAG: efflux RND transporter periplasmic adaptor subunit [Lacipirellulaceae bacterium]
MGPRARAFVFVTVAIAGACLAARPAGAEGTAALRPAEPAAPSVSALVRLIEEVTTPARASGVVASVRVKEGDLVEAGALLATVDDTQARLSRDRAAVELALAEERVKNDVAVRSAERALVFAKEEYTRLSRAIDELPGSISVSELEESRFAAQRAELDVEQARRELDLERMTARLKEADTRLAAHELELRRLRAPIGGMVIDVLRRPGEWVEPGEDVLRIVRIDRLRAEGLFDHRSLQGAAIGAAAVVEATSADGKPLATPGQVAFVHPEVNPINGQVRVWVDFDNPGGRLRPGLRVRVRIDGVAAPKSMNSAAPKRGT